MLIKEDYKKVRDFLAEYVTCVQTEQVPIGDAVGRVLAQDIYALADVPPFDRSAYDGYALRAADSQIASPDQPLTLDVLEEVAAGQTPTKTVTAGSATKILTGAPIPEGADCVVAFEKTTFDKQHVTVFHPLRTGENIVRKGEDVQAGDVLAKGGVYIDPGMVGTMASLGIQYPTVYRKPVIGLLSTGSELTDLGNLLEPGKIYNSNSHTIGAALRHLGCEVRDLGLVRDDISQIALLFQQGLEGCDAIISTGGVSVGDYDLVPAAMRSIGADILAAGLWMKPGMASAFAVKDGKFLFGLSGNPASSLTTFYAVVQPVIQKLMGLEKWCPLEFAVMLRNGFSKPSPKTRLLRGTLNFEGCVVGIDLLTKQGNAVISSAIGSDVMAIVPAGSGPIPAGTQLQAFLL